MELSTNPIIRFIERAGQKIPDPILIFIYFFVFAFILTAVIGGLTFERLPLMVRLSPIRLKIWLIPNTSYGCLTML